MGKKEAKTERRKMIENGALTGILALRLGLV
jgi:hypothetical protein